MFLSLARKNIFYTKKTPSAEADIKQNTIILSVAPKLTLNDIPC